MRRTVAAIIILILSVSIGVFSHFYVKTVCNQAISGVEEILDNAVTQDKERVNQMCVQLNTIWNKKVFLLNILIGREYTNEVSKHCNKMLYFSESADYDSVITIAEDCKAELVNIIRSNELDLSTIF